MKKIISIILVSSLLISALTMLTSCFGDNRTINVYSDGSSAPIESEDSINIFLNGGTGINPGEKAKFEDIIAARPSKEGFDFAGWYSDSSFTNYIFPTDITKAQRTKGTAYAKWIKVEPTSYVVREGTATITDSGRAKQQLDRVGMTSYYDVTDLKRAGYTKLTVSLSADVREIDDGYQYIFLYSNTKCASNDISSVMDFYDKYVFGEESGDPSLLYMHKFEHGSGVVDESWKTVSFEITLDLNRFTDDLYIRYGASGKSDDDWVNKNINVTIIPEK